MTFSFNQFFNRLWYGKPWWSWWLLPLSWLFQGLVSWRRRYWQYRQSNTVQASPPVVVVGNINVGGTGKTPLVIALARHLSEQGWRVGIVSRGYGSQAKHWPLWLEANTRVSEAGDEPWMIRRATGCPLVIGPNRPASIAHLVGREPVDVIISDDGLQHYAMTRTVELAVVDGERGLGNGYLLPAGPLREPPARLQQCDYVVSNGEPSQRVRGQLPNCVIMQLRAQHWHNLQTGATRAATDLVFSEPVHAMAGIGNPQRFFNTLQQLGLNVIPHPMTDHQQFTWQDLAFAHQQPLLMTEKDAVKVAALMDEQTNSGNMAANWWYLSVNATLPETLLTGVVERLTPFIAKKDAATNSVANNSVVKNSAAQTSLSVTPSQTTNQPN